MNDDLYSLRALREAEDLPSEPAPPENIRAFAEHRVLWRAMEAQAVVQDREACRQEKQRGELVKIAARLEAHFYRNAWAVWHALHFNVWACSWALSYLAPHWLAVGVFCALETALLLRQPRREPLKLGGEE